MLRQMTMNRYGIFQFLKKQVREHQTKYLELQSQYQNTQDIKQQIEIMKSIIKTRHLIDEQDDISLDTLESYHNFIDDYQKCLRIKLNINQETTELYNQVTQKFMDYTIFDKIKENSMFSQKTIDVKFLQLNSLILLIEVKYELMELEPISDLINKMLLLVKEYDGPKLHQVQILGFIKYSIFQQMNGQLKESKESLIKGLEEIKLLKQQQDNQSNVITESDKEWIFLIEGKIYWIMAQIYQMQDQRENCIECQDKTLHLIKDYEGISQHYVYTLYQLNNQFGYFNQFRVLKMIEETCSQIEKSEGYLFLQYQRILYLASLDQLNIKEYDRIIRIHQEIKVYDDNFQTAFYSTILICSTRLKFYSDLNKWIDLMFSHISTITQNQFNLLVCQRKALYEQFLNQKFNHNKNVCEKTMMYYQEKAHPYFAEIEKKFSENYFNLSVGSQRQVRENMLEILQDYLTRSIYGNDPNLIRVALEKTFQLFIDNPNYRETLQILFKGFNDLLQYPLQVKTQLSEYLEQLQEPKIQ
ncbi:hypothetical protein pb186bvf_011837 [Paramecium bursaria]